MVDRNMEEKLPARHWEPYFAFVDKGFRMRRKMLVNVLGHDFGKQEWGRLLGEIHADPASRPEDLSAGQWLELYKKSCGL
jgi:16S rRNA A1518/A1519 N6-dimethyltransferase RsmA/KsgA/DIM1 with predicted DNA glycosylase/AP lyase activity